jgi:hypothetical protein
MPNEINLLPPGVGARSGTVRLFTSAFSPVGGKSGMIALAEGITE